MHNTLTEVAFYFGVNPTCQPTSVVGNKLGINFIGYTLYVYATCTSRIKHILLSLLLKHVHTKLLPFAWSRVHINTDLYCQ